MILSSAKNLSLLSTSVVMMAFSSLLYTNCSQQGFQVREQNGSGNFASSDPTGVAVTFKKAPPDLVTTSDVSFSYDLSGTNLSYVSTQCYLNSMAMVSCASPLTLSSLKDNDYTLTVAATNQNGLVLAEGKRSFRIDRQAPVLTVNQAPAATIGMTSASIAFSVTDNFPGALSYCAVDGDIFNICTSPLSLSNLTLAAHAVKIYAQDKAGNKSATQTISFIVNLAVPSMTLSAMPAAFSNMNSASFSFSGTSSSSTIASYQCSLDNAAFAACTSPKSYASLAEGSHSFSVKAVDVLGQSSSPTSYSFSVDLTTPSSPAVSSNLISPSKTTSLNLTFNSTDASGVAKYECKLDAGAYATCVSPQAFANLASTSHTFTVRATDKAGNVSAEGSYTIVIDTEAPVVSITSQPASSTQSTSASFSFTVTDALAGMNLIECQLDTQMYTTCASPQAYSNLAVGNHSFNLRGTDKAGNSTVKNYTWTITAASTPTPTPQSGTALAGDIVDSSGNIVADAYKTMAADYSSDSAIAYRYGPDYGFYNPMPAAVPTYYYPGDHIMYPHGNTCFQADYPQFPVDKTAEINYQVGGLNCKQGDYGSNMGDVIYRADATTDSGVTALLTQNFNYGTISEKPQNPWFWYPQATSPATSPHVIRYKADNGGVVPTKPVAQGRCVDHWCPEALVAFQNGLIVTTGSNTASSQASVKLAPGKVPTAVAVTTNAEFALVTVWDTVNLKGQVAVIALASLCPGCNLDGPYNSFDEWLGVYPGLKNQGFIGFMKVLGYVDLPGMMAPTEISAATDYAKMEDPQQGWLFASNDTSKGAAALPSQMTPHLSQSNFSTFVPGGANAKYLSKAGIAAVISKSEKKVIFLNLKPLFDKVNSTYFGGTLAQLQSTLASRGQGDSQWPPVFAVNNYAPTYIKTLSLTGTPTAVRVSFLPDVGKTWVATQDGVIHTITSAGLQAGTDLNPDSIKEISTMKVGRNPTSIVYKTMDYRTSPDQLWVLSRGDRRVDLLNVKTAMIEKTLQDSRMVDPISMHDTRQNPGGTFVFTVVDYAGKQVLNYRYQPTDVHGGNTGTVTYGMGASGTDLFEFGGGYSVPGKPFQFTQSNVP